MACAVRGRGRRLLRVILLPVSRLLFVLLAAALACSSFRPPPVPPPPAPPRPPSPEALLKEAIALRAAGDLDAARANLEAALAASPRADPVRNELAELLLAEGSEIDGAAEVLAGADAASAGPRFHLLFGRLAELQADDERAAAAYERALALGIDPEVRFQRALVLDRLGRTDEAITELEALRAVRPAAPGLALALADRYEAAGRIPEAEAELVRAAEAAPERAAGWDRLARFHARQGRDVEARAAEARARALEAKPARALRPLLPSRR